jgi:hypothetical protein
MPADGVFQGAIIRCPFHNLSGIENQPAPSQKMMLKRAFLRENGPKAKAKPGAKAGVNARSQPERGGKMPRCGIGWKKPGFPEPNRKQAKGQEGGERPTAQRAGAEQSVIRQAWFRQFHRVVFPGSARAGIGADRIHIRRLNMAQTNGGG